MPAKENLKKLFSVAIRAFLSVGLLIFLFRRFDFTKTWNLIKGVNLGYFALVLLLALFINFLLLLRWYMLIRTSGLRISFYRVTAAFSMGLFFNLFLPSSAGGDVARSIDLFGQTGEKTKIVASVILDRLSGFISIAIISSISLFIGYKLVNDKSILLILLIVVSSLITLLAVLFSSTIFLKLCRLFSSFKSIKLNLENLHRSIIIYRSKYSVIFVNVLLSFITQILAIVAFYLIALSLHTRIGFIYFLIFVPLIFAISMLPVSVGGLGVREGSFVYLFSKIGVSPNISLSISFFNFATLLIIGFAGGIIYVFALHSRRLQYRKASLFSSGGKS